MPVDNVYTKMLWAELISEKPSELKIRKLIEQGANIKKDFLIELMYLVYPPDTWEERKGRGLDLNFVSLIIELGAEINYKKNGVNCLGNACNTYNPDLIELLLRKGANPNCTYNTDNQSLLEWAKGLLHLETYVYKRKYQSPLEKIIQLFEDYQGRNLLC